MIRNKTYQSLLGSIDCFAENKSIVHFKNLVWCLRNNSLKDMGETWAMVGTILAGSSSDIEMQQSIGLVSSVLCLNIFAIMIGIY